MAVAQQAAMIQQHEATIQQLSLKYQAASQPGVAATQPMPGGIADPLATPGGAVHMFAVWLS